MEFLTYNLVKPLVVLASCGENRHENSFQGGMLEDLFKDMVRKGSEIYVQKEAPPPVRLQSPVLQPSRREKGHTSTGHLQKTQRRTPIPPLDNSGSHRTFQKREHLDRVNSPVIQTSAVRERLGKSGSGRTLSPLWPSPTHPDHSPTLEGVIHDGLEHQTVPHL